MSNGKGDKDRKNFNYKKFRDNMDQIDWSKKDLTITKQPEKDKKHGN